MGDGSGTAWVGVPGASSVTFAKAAELEARGAELAGVLAVAAAGLVEVLAEAVATDAWRGCGIRSVEHWASLRFGLSAGRARRLAAAAERLRQLPACRAAFTAGEITEGHVAAVARAQVSPVHDVQAANLARHGTPGQLRRALSALPPVPCGGGAAAAPAPAVPGERLWTGVADDGTWLRLRPRRPRPWCGHRPGPAGGARPAVPCPPPRPRAERGGPVGDSRHGSAGARGQARPRRHGPGDGDR